MTTNNGRPDLNQDAADAIAEYIGDPSNDNRTKVLQLQSNIIFEIHYLETGANGFDLFETSLRSLYGVDEFPRDHVAYPAVIQGRIEAGKLLQMIESYRARYKQLTAAIQKVDVNVDQS